MGYLNHDHQSRGTEITRVNFVWSRLKRRLKRRLDRQQIASKVYIEWIGTWGIKRRWCSWVSLSMAGSIWQEMLSGERKIWIPNTLTLKSFKENSVGWTVKLPTGAEYKHFNRVSPRALDTCEDYGLLRPTSHRSSPLRCFVPCKGFPNIQASFVGLIFPNLQHNHSYGAR
mgnify:CR=1 FL=1